MNHRQGTIDHMIARAARAFEKQRTKHGRKWVAVFMNEDTIVIALHGSLTAAEKVLAQSSAGIAKVREFHQQLFATNAAALHRKIKSIAGMIVRDTTSKIEATTGSVVQVFTTETAVEDFLFTSAGPASRRQDALHGPAPTMARAAKPPKTGCVGRR